MKERKWKVYWMPVARDFGYFRHAVDHGSRIQYCRNLHLWFFGIGIYHWRSSDWIEKLAALKEKPNE